MSSTVESSLVISPAQAGALIDALKLPDVSAIDVDRLEPQDQVTLAHSLDAQLASAASVFAAICAPIIALRDAAKTRVLGAIVDNGGTMLVHDTFDVTAVQKMEREKRIDVLRRLEGVLPDDLYREAVFVKAVSQGTGRDALVA